MEDNSSHAEDPDAELPRDPDQDRREHLNAVLVRVAQGDRQSFAELYRLTSSRLFGLIVRMLHDRHEAEDVLQEVYTAAWRRADTFDPTRASAMTWLMTLGRNRAIDRLRQRREDEASPRDGRTQDVPQRDGYAKVSGRHDVSP